MLAKLKSGAGLASILVALAGCGVDLAKTARSGIAPNEGSSTEDYAYLSDSAEASAEDEGGDEGAVSESAVDENVEGDLVDERITSMAKRMLSDLDGDQDGSLSLDEFLSGPEKFHKKCERSRIPELSDEQKATMTKNLTADFEKYAGEDVLLSEEEIKTFLLEKGPKVAEFRRKGHGHPPHLGDKGGKGGKGKDGRGPRRMPEEKAPSVQEIYAKFDTDSDGVLSQDEFQKMLDERRPARR